MAGGPSTPELAAAVSEAGGLGFLAAGYLVPDVLQEVVERTRALTTRPFGVNVFIPQPSVAVPEQVAAYASVIAGEATALGTQLGDARFDDDHWEAKLALLIELAPAVVSCTFGCPTAEEVAALHAAGCAVVVTVTERRELEVAVRAGADAVVVQGPEAGGHRGTFDPAANPSDAPLETALAELLHRSSVPVIAAGGLMTRTDVARVLAQGAAAAQLGTAFLLADEAGTRDIHRRALADPSFTTTATTRAFSGRVARGLENEFMRHHETDAIAGYPEVHHMTSPLRAAAAAAGDPQRTSLWAGTGYHQVRPGRAADIVASLTP
ncbi:MAG: nitroalkane oxidase [Thermoleophilia bacterium]|nr:nitroalkane oxidase [Thermoleophilia bacterium]